VLDATDPAPLEGVLHTVGLSRRVEGVLANAASSMPVAAPTGTGAGEMSVDITMLAV
jgi:hypothetical protein